MSEKLRPARAVKPGDILREELEERGWTQKDFAEIIGRPAQAVNEIITGKKSITPDTAILFSEAFGTSAELWLNLESSYRLWHAEASLRASDVAQKAALYEAAPIKEMIEKGWIKAEKSIDNLQQQVLTFFSVSDLEQLQLQTSARSRVSGSRTPEQIALFTWLRRAEIVASNASADAYSQEGLKAAVAGLRSISKEADQIYVAQQKLAELGVRLVIVPHLKKTYVDGAAFWLNETSPVVALSLRHNRIDNFWFTLMHELAHILLHSEHGIGSFVDENVGVDMSDHLEQQANSVATEWLISQREFDDFLVESGKRYSKDRICAFARRLGIHPAIVVGKIQHLSGNYRLMRELLSGVCNRADIDSIHQAA